MAMDDEGEGHQGEKISNTFQPKFSSTKTIVEQAKENGKELGEALTLRDGVIINRADLILALV